MILKRMQQRQGGYTLLEIMIVVVIIGILLAIGIPLYYQWLPNYRHKSAMRDLQGHFQMAKLEAIKRGANPAAIVTIEFTTGVFDPSGRIGSYILFVDTNGNMIFDAGADVAITQVNMPTNVSLTGATCAVNGNGNPSLAFNSRGFPTAASLGAGTITARNSLNVEGTLTLSLSGQGVLTRRTSSDGGVTWTPAAIWD